MRSAAARRPSSAPRWEGPRNGPRNRPQSRCYTNLCQWVGHYGNDDVALNNFNTNVAAIAL